MIMLVGQWWFEPFNPIVVVLWFAFLVIAAFIFEKQTRWFTRFGIFTTLLGAMFILYGIAIPFSDNVNATVTHLPISSHDLANYYLAVMLAYLGIMAGILIVRGGLLSRFAGLTRIRAGTVVDPNALLVVGLALVALIVLVWVILPWDTFQGGLSAIFSLGHSEASYRQHRVDYGSATRYAASVINYLGSFARFALMPAVIWVLWFHRRFSRRVTLLFWGSLGLLLGIGLFSGQKAAVAIFLVGFVFAWLIKKGQPSIFNWKIGAAGAVLVLVVLAALYHLQVPNLNYASLLFGLLFRLTGEYSRVAQLRFEFYPERHDYLHGMSSFILRGAAHLVGIKTGDAESPETYIPTHSPGVGAGYGGTWNAGFFADAWADFGFVGVIVAALAVGVIVALIEQWYQHSGKGALEMGVYTALCISALYVSEVALLTSLWTYGLLSSFIVYWVFRRFPKRERAQAEAGFRTYAAMDRAPSG